MTNKTLMALAAIAVAASCPAQATSSGPFEDAEEKTLSVQCEDASGSGFVCEMDGKRYFITVKHVIAGQRRVVAYFGNGQKLKLGRMEIAENADLVRFAVASNQPAFKLAEGESGAHKKLCILANRNGKTSRIDGKSLAGENGKTEISARFTHREAGAPVLNENGEVVGVAAFDAKSPNPQDWIKTGAGNQKIRRFAVKPRLSGWKSTDLTLFCRKTKAAEKNARTKAGIFPQARAVFKSPSMRINKSLKYDKTEYFINGNIVLGLSDIRGIKNPVVRLAVLVEGSNQTVIDAASDEPGGKFAYSCVPIDSYGMAKTSRSFNIGNDISACYLEGISFYQPTSKFDSLPGGGKNIEYFDRSILLSGGLKIPDSATKGGTAPKIVAYRLECWQNGTLAGVYDSMRPDTLNSKDIPVDWFVIGRYPEKFVYAENCRYGQN